MSRKRVLMQQLRLLLKRNHLMLNFWIRKKMTIFCAFQIKFVSVDRKGNSCKIWLTVFMSSWMLSLIAKRKLCLLIRPPFRNCLFLSRAWEKSLRVPSRTSTQITWMMWLWHSETQDAASLLFCQLCLWALSLLLRRISSTWFRGKREAKLNRFRSRER